MRMVISLIMLAMLSFLPAQAEGQAWTGKISDSICGAAHKPALEHAGARMTDHDCAVACVKKGGKYVLVSQGKVYHIVNQDFDGLEQHAGRTVKLAGELLGDSIKVTNIATR